MRYLAILLCLFCVNACGNDAPAATTDAGVNPATAAPADAPPPDANEPLQTEPWHYPRERIVDGNRVIVYTPQIRSWPDFSHFEAVAAIEFHPKDGSAPHYGTTVISGDTEVDLEKRLVIVTAPKVDDVTFAGTGTDAADVTMTNMVLRERVEVPLDMFLLYLSDDVLETPPPKGFNTAPPPIHVADSPTLLLFINGKPVLTPVEQTGLELVVNANFPVLRDTASGAYYLITGPQRLTAKKLEGPWTKATELPAGFAKIDPKGPQAAIAAAAATPIGDAPLPKVINSSVPAELIVTDGKPQPEEIPDTGGLAFIANTDSPLFVLKGTYYYLVSGRWFETKKLAKGPWKFVPNLPDAFSKIPADHEMAEVRASVPGTVEAKTAALEALLPTRNSIAVGAAPDVKVAYGGEPKFEPITGTQVSRAVNSGNDVILYDGSYYLCYEGAWYISTSPSGPWTATATVPDAIYKIPPDSPSYPVTQVTVYESTPTDRRLFVSAVVQHRHLRRVRCAVVRHRLVLPAVHLLPVLLPVLGRVLRPWLLVQPDDRCIRFALGLVRTVRRLQLQPGLQPEHRPIRLCRNRVGRRRLEEPQREVQPAHRHLERNVAPLQRRQKHVAHGTRDPRSERQRDRHGTSGRLRQADRDHEPQDVERR